MSNNIAIFGAGGFGREIACLLQMINQSGAENWNLIGFFDDGITAGTKNEYGRVLGGIDELNAYDEDLSVVIAVGNSVIIQAISKKITNPRIHFPNIIAPSVLFLDRNSLKIGRGNIICANCLLSCNITLGDFNIFNGSISVGHDAQIGNYNVVMPSVNISGCVQIGDCNFFGVQSVILQKIKIGTSVRIAAGSVIIRNTQDGNLYLGNPGVKMEL